MASCKKIIRMENCAFAEQCLSSNRALLDGRRERKCSNFGLLKLDGLLFKLGEFNSLSLRSVPSYLSLYLSICGGRPAMSGCGKDTEMPPEFKQLISICLIHLHLHSLAVCLCVWSHTFLTAFLDDLCILSIALCRFSGHNALKRICSGCNPFLHLSAWVRTRPRRVRSWTEWTCLASTAHRFVERGESVLFVVT